MKVRKERVLKLWEGVEELKRCLEQDETLALKISDEFFDDFAVVNYKSFIFESSTHTGMIDKSTQRVVSITVGALSWTTWQSNKRRKVTVIFIFCMTFRTEPVLAFLAKNHCRGCTSTSSGTSSVGICLKVSLKESKPRLSYRRKRLLELPKKVYCDSWSISWPWGTYSWSGFQTCRIEISKQCRLCPRFFEPWSVRMARVSQWRKGSASHQLVHGEVVVLARTAQAYLLGAGSSWAV